MPNFRSQSLYRAYFVEHPLSKFTVATGGDHQIPNTRVHPGGGGPTVIVEGEEEVQDLQVEKPLELDIDQPLLNALAAYKRDRTRLTLVRIPVNADGAPVGAPETFIRCAVSNWKKPDRQAGSSEAAMLTITVSPEDAV